MNFYTCKGLFLHSLFCLNGQAFFHAGANKHYITVVL